MAVPDFLEPNPPAILHGGWGVSDVLEELRELLNLNRLRRVTARSLNLPVVLRKSQLPFSWLLAFACSQRQMIF